MHLSNTLVKIRTFLALFTAIVTTSAGAATFQLPDDGGALVGQNHQVPTKYEDTFAKLAREFGVGYDALRRANPGVDAWLPGENTMIQVPLRMLLPRVAREGIVINLSEMRLYQFSPDGEQVHVFPIGIGSEGRETPIMRTRTVAKIEDPVWYPTEAILARHAAEGRTLARKVPPGPDNPLGSFAIKLARDGYFIHGTNQPIGVGQRVSSGCIRLYEPDIELLVTQTPNGTPVNVIHQPFKAGWHAGQLYLEAHRNRDGQVQDYSDAVAAIIAATANRPAKIDWQLVVATARAATGIPVAVSTN